MIRDKQNMPLPPCSESPSDIIEDESARMFCVVCKVFVPRGDINVEQHLKGKKHLSCSRTLSDIQRSERRTHFLAMIAEGKTLDDESVLVSSASGSNPPSRVLTEGPMSGLQQVVSSSQTDNETSPLSGEDGRLPPQGVVDQLLAVGIDKEKYIASLLDDDRSDEVDFGQDVDGSICDAKGDPEEEACTKFFGRLTGFRPLNYKAPAGASDIIYDDMADETKASEKAQSIKNMIVNLSGDSTHVMLRRAPEMTEYISLEHPTRHFNNESSPALSSDPLISAEFQKRTNADTENNKAPTKVEENIAASGEGELPPWLLGDDAIEAVRYNPESTLALHYEILEFARFISPTVGEAESRRSLVRTVTSIAQALWPDCKVEVFGSYATDLYLPTSDIDVCIMNTPEGGGKSPDFVEHLELAQAIRNVKDFARRVNFIKARVPLVKIVARNSNVQCDISFNRMNGPANVPVIEKYLVHFPSLKPLLLVLKCFLQQRSLNEVFSGGLGSYSVLLLVVSHLQMQHFNFPGSKANLGTVLQNFFLLYGRLFNYCLVGIRVKDGGSYYDKFEKYHTAPHEALRYSIEDPNDETNELGRNSYASSRIRKAFGNAYSSLCKWRRDDQEGPITPLSSILHVDNGMAERRKVVLNDLVISNTQSLRRSIVGRLNLNTKSAVAEDSVPKTDRHVDTFAQAKYQSSSVLPTRQQGLVSQAARIERSGSSSGHDRTSSRDIADSAGAQSGHRPAHGRERPSKRQRIETAPEPADPVHRRYRENAGRGGENRIVGGGVSHGRYEIDASLQRTQLQSGPSSNGTYAAQFPRRSRMRQRPSYHR